MLVRTKGIVRLRKSMLLYIKNNIQYQKLDISSIANANPSEIIAVELLLKENIILACIYRSPNSTPNNSTTLPWKICRDISVRIC